MFILPKKVIKTIEKILRFFLYRKDVTPKARGVKVLCEMLQKKGFGIYNMNLLLRLVPLGSMRVCFCFFMIFFFFVLMNSMRVCLSIEEYELRIRVFMGSKGSLQFFLDLKEILCC